MKTSIQNIITILFFFTFSISFAQNIEGVVTTSENIPLEAVNVVIKGTTYSALTDNSGKFTIDSNGRLPLTLLVQYVGYTTAEIELTSIPVNPIQVALKEENELIEVVVSSRRRIEKFRMCQLLFL